MGFAKDGAGDIPNRKGIKETRREIASKMDGIS